MLRDTGSPRPLKWSGGAPTRSLLVEVVFSWPGLGRLLAPPVQVRGQVLDGYLLPAAEEHGALDYSIIVAATASEPAPMQYLAPYSATAMAEFFESIDWPSLRPAQDLLASQPGSDDVLRWVGIARAQSGTLVAYTAGGDPIEFTSAPGSNATWISPRTGERQPAVAAGTTYKPPTRTDWTLLITR